MQMRRTAPTFCSTPTKGLILRRSTSAHSPGVLGACARPPAQHATAVAARGRSDSHLRVQSVEARFPPGRAPDYSSLRLASRGQPKKRSGTRGEPCRRCLKKAEAVELFAREVKSKIGGNV